MMRRSLSWLMLLNLLCFTGKACQVLYEKDAESLSAALLCGDYDKSFSFIRSKKSFKNYEFRWDCHGFNCPKIEVLLKLYTELIERDYDVNNFWFDYPWYCIWLGYYGNHSEKVIGFLVKNGASINYSKDDKTPLFEAIQQYNIQAVTYLLLHGADPNQKANRLHFAPRSEDARSHLETPLAYAIHLRNMHSNLEGIIRILRNYGALL